MGTMSKGYLVAEVKNIIKIESEAVRDLNKDDALNEMAMQAADSLEQLFKLHFEPTFNEGNLEQEITIAALEDENTSLAIDLEKAIEANESFKEANNDLKESYEEAVKVMYERLEQYKAEITWLRSIVEKAVKQ